MALIAEGYIVVLLYDKKSSSDKNQRQFIFYVTGRNCRFRGLTEKELYDRECTIFWVVRGVTTMQTKQLQWDPNMRGGGRSQATK